MVEVPVVPEQHSDRYEVVGGERKEKEKRNEEVLWTTDDPTQSIL